MSVNGNAKVQIMVIHIQLTVPAVSSDLGKETQRVAIRDAVEKGFLPLQKSNGMYLDGIVMQRQGEEEGHYSVPGQ